MSEQHSGPVLPFAYWMLHLLRISDMQLRVVSQLLSLAIPALCSNAHEHTYKPVTLAIMALCSDAHEHSYKPVTLVCLCVDITAGMGSFVSDESGSRIHNLQTPLQLAA